MNDADRWSLLVAASTLPVTAGGHRFVSTLQHAAQRSKLPCDHHRAWTPAELDDARATIGRSGAQALLVTSAPLSATHRQAIVALATARRLPAIYAATSFVDDGGLMSYGPNNEHVGRRAAAHVDRILEDTKAGDIPVEQPTVYELALNPKRARAGADDPEGLVGWR